MEPVRMIHPHHGAMHAYTYAEIERLQGLGWEAEKPEQLERQEQIEQPPAVKPKRKYTKRQVA